MFTDFLSKLEPLLFPSQVVREDGLNRVIQQIKKGKKPEAPSPLFYEAFSDFFDNDENLKKEDVTTLFLKYYGYTMASVERMSLIVARYNAFLDISKKLEGESFSAKIKKNSIFIVGVFEGWILKIRYIAILKEIKEFLHVELENDTNTLKVDNKLVLTNEMLNDMLKSPDLASLNVKFKESLVRKAGILERKWRCNLEKGSNCLEFLSECIDNDPKLRIYKPEVVIGYSELKFKTSQAIPVAFDSDAREIPAIQVQTDNYFRKKAIVCHFTLSLATDTITRESWDDLKRHLVGLMPISNTNIGS